MAVPAVSVVASLDGLVCLASRDCFHATFALWNPLTRASKTLPSIHGFLYTGHPVGFYYDDSCNDYKLVCLIHSGLYRLGAYVYSHRLDSWREIEFPFAFSHDQLLTIWSPATFCGQCVYFTLTYITESGHFGIYEAQSFSCIICFDIKTETFRKIQFPHVLHDDDYYSGSLVVLNGCLHLCVSYQLLKHWELRRMMDGTDDKWVKVAAFSGVEPQRICTASAGNWLAVLDQDDNSFKKMNINDVTKHYRYFSSPNMEYRSSRVTYVDTLVSPNL
ncbi:F-box/kelch-repeat protein At3g06240-like [Bidens hawaiensis]|uniref:F-box/kelch-repeat protein At3g06240-like n=1 Tax=Bidens hawaiensis TaxID=980011 RepID=UPI00404A28AA